MAVRNETVSIDTMAGKLASAPILMECAMPLVWRLGEKVDGLEEAEAIGNGFGAFDGRLWIETDKGRLLLPDGKYITRKGATVMYCTREPHKFIYSPHLPKVIGTTSDKAINWVSRLKKPLSAINVCGCKESTYGTSFTDTLLNLVGAKRATIEGVGTITIYPDFVTIDQLEDRETLQELYPLAKQLVDVTLDIHQLPQEGPFDNVHILSKSLTEARRLAKVWWVRRMRRIRLQSSRARLITRLQYLLYRGIWNEA